MVIVAGGSSRQKTNVKIEELTREEQCPIQILSKDRFASLQRDVFATVVTIPIWRKYIYKINTSKMLTVNKIDTCSIGHQLSILMKEQQNQQEHPQFEDQYLYTLNISKDSYLSMSMLHIEKYTTFFLSSFIYQIT